MQAILEKVRIFHFLQCASVKSIACLRFEIFGSNECIASLCHFLLVLRPLHWTCFLLLLMFLLQTNS